MIIWEGSVLRCDGVAILDGEQRRGQTVRVSRHRNAEGQASYAINNTAAAEAAWTIAIPVHGAVSTATVTQEG